ncbi:dethiobiotin synthase [Acidiferrimicrobium sp. IK]|uniref:ATP-dependent dethiobiotin synthetase BioD n=1 Tax=Acidiferrimicrobium sp. IK TaxID=2871700 RepID=UPI0021CB07C6|nr:dethiobiotin synthase [Acidiferrimicrobium sp. IK]MCU4186704.1 dethiobiotin synthase [Acidiferrimicrobium sp. IK]
MSDHQTGPAHRTGPAGRPARLVAVVGTGTEVGKTWVTREAAAGLVAAGRSGGAGVAVRKPAQSFDADRSGAPLEPTDADLLAEATGEDRLAVCPAHRWYPLPMAPPMAADALGRPPIAVADLLDELQWAPGTELGLVETAGGVRSPLAHDADGATFARLLRPDLTVLVADAGLGTINAVRLSLAALAPLDVIVVLNRYDPGDDLHVRNRDWLVERDGYRVVTEPRQLDL